MYFNPNVLKEVAKLLPKYIEEIQYEDFNNLNKKENDFVNKTYSIDDFRNLSLINDQCEFLKSRGYVYNYYMIDYNNYLFRLISTKEPILNYTYMEFTKPVIAMFIGTYTDEEKRIQGALFSKLYKKCLENNTPILVFGEENSFEIESTENYTIIRINKPIKD